MDKYQAEKFYGKEFLSKLSLDNAIKKKKKQVYQIEVPLEFIKKKMSAHKKELISPDRKGTTAKLELMRIQTIMDENNKNKTEDVIREQRRRI